MNNGQDLRLRDVNPSKQAELETTKNGDVRKSVAADKITEDHNVNDKVTLKEKCGELKENCNSCCMPCLASYHPLPKDASVFQRFKHGLMLPPHGNLASYIQFAVVCFQIWIVLYTLTNVEALPGGNLFSLFILFVCCAIGGYLISFVHLPPLLGMLIVGLLLRNVPVIKTVGESISPSWSGAFRKIALTVILTRGGLGLDIVKLRRLSWAVLRLAWLPCLGEIITAGIVSKFLLGFPWFWSLLLGCIMGALSPAVTVPSLVNLQDRRYGVNKGIPTMLLAAGGLDNVFCLTGFSVFLGIIFSEGDLIVTIFKGPIGVFVGIVYGFIMGIFLWFIPSKDCANRVFFRSVMLVCSGLIAIFGSSKIGLSGAGPLGCLTTATVAAYKWRKERQPGEPDEVSGVLALTWLIVQHFLFGLIGSAVDVNKIHSETAGLGIATLLIGLVVRSVISFSVTMGIGFNLKERVFVTLTWLAKATVQAAVGGMALDAVRSSQDPDPNELKYATDVLTISVLAILICAPTGATLMAVLGPRFLKHGNERETVVSVRKKTKIRTSHGHKDTGDDEEVFEEKKEDGAVVKEIELSEKFIHITETDPAPNDIRPIDDQKFKTELSLTLKNRSSKLLENEPALGHVEEQPFSGSSNNGGIDNPAFTEQDATPVVEVVRKVDNSTPSDINNTENSDIDTEKQTEPSTTTENKTGIATDVDSVSNTKSGSAQVPDSKTDSADSEGKYRTVVEINALT